MRKRSQEFVAFLGGTLLGWVEGQQLHFLPLLLPLPRPRLLLRVDPASGKGALVGETGKLMVQQSGWPMDLYTFGSDFLEFITIPSVFLLFKAFLRSSSLCVLLQHLEESVYYKKRIASSEDGWVRHCSLAAVIEVRSIEQFRQFVERTAMVAEGKPMDITMMITNLFWVLFDCWYVCRERVHGSHLQFELFESEIIYLLSIFSCQFVRLSEIPLELALHWLGLHPQLSIIIINKKFPFPSLLYNEHSYPNTQQIR